MSITRERFAQGLTYDAYKAQMTSNRVRLEDAEQTVQLDASEVAFWAQLAQPLHILVLTEDWCDAAIDALPVLARLVLPNPLMQLRFFLRDQNPDLRHQYLKDGAYAAIPTVVVFDCAFRELGRWIERPAMITRLFEQRRQALATDPVFAGVDADTPFADLPDAAQQRVMDALIAFRQETRVLADRELVRELRAIVERGLGGTVSTGGTACHDAPHASAAPSQR